MMRRLGASLVLGTLVFGTVAVQAAPTAPIAPAATPAPAPSIRVTDAIGVVGEVIPMPAKCGEPTKGRVKLTNNATKDWKGVVSFTSPQQTTVDVSLTASGSPGATKIVDVSGPNLDCKKPLSIQELRVFPFGVPSKVVVTKVMKPKTVTAVQAMTLPPPTETRVFLRRATFEATCGGNLLGRVTLHAFGSGPEQDATLKLGFGQYVSNHTAKVRPNQPTDVTMTALPKPVECQAPNGIPAFEYTLSSGLGASGKLDPQEVTFE